MLTCLAQEQVLQSSGGCVCFHSDYDMLRYKG
jgi:hypothetical protein